MAFQAKDGKKFTNRPPMMAHNRSMDRGQSMTATDPLQNPAGQDDSEDHGAPVMTHHHEDGTHTTVHEDGHEAHHESHEALHEHLKKHMPQEQQQEGEPDGDEAEYE
jgi:hypothetical protein